MRLIPLIYKHFSAWVSRVHCTCETDVEEDYINRLTTQDEPTKQRMKTRYALLLHDLQDVSAKPSDCIVRRDNVITFIPLNIDLDSIQEVHRYVFEIIKEAWTQEDSINVMVSFEGGTHAQLRQFLETYDGKIASSGIDIFTTIPCPIDSISIAVPDKSWKIPLQTLMLFMKPHVRKRVTIKKKLDEKKNESEIDSRESCWTIKSEQSRRILGSANLF